MPQTRSVNRQIADVRFERVRINGTVVASAKDMALEIGPFVSNVTFSSSSIPIDIV